MEKAELEKMEINISLKPPILVWYIKVNPVVRRSRNPIENQPVLFLIPPLTSQLYFSFTSLEELHSRMVQWSR
jgi:hypothetical protein